MRVCYGMCVCVEVNTIVHTIYTLYIVQGCVVVRSVHVCMSECVYMGYVCV